MICKLLRIFVNILTANGKYFLLNRDKPRRPIQMQLSQKQITFPQLVSAFFKARLNFANFFKKRERSQLMYFRNYGIRNQLANKCLKIPLSEDRSTSNMVRGPNTVEIWTTLALPYLLIIVQVIELEKINHSNMQILRNDC